ncbi:MAG TPA: hypothetical protein VK912_04190 [Longimicrobiales bacterium]|nr:hypothetical protein [Longimicrobiales bacterium]
MRSILTVTALATAAGVAIAACDGAAPTDSIEATAHDHDAALAGPSPAFQKKMAELRKWSAPFHNLDAAAAAGYDLNFGCVDETVNGVDPSIARGMGYHVTRGDVDIVNDGVIDIDQPEFLVYAPHQNDAQLPKEERLRAARLVAFDYYVPASEWLDPDPPEFFGMPFHWSEAFQGWIRHFYLWGNNPDGITSDFNPATALCTELLNP